MQKHLGVNNFLRNLQAPGIVIDGTTMYLFTFFIFPKNCQSLLNQSDSLNNGWGHFTINNLFHTIKITHYLLTGTPRCSGSLKYLRQGTEDAIC